MADRAWTLRLAAAGWGDLQVLERWPIEDLILAHAWLDFRRHAESVYDAAEP